MPDYALAMARGRSARSTALVVERRDDWALAAARRQADPECAALVDDEVRRWLEGDERAIQAAAECGRTRLALPVGVPVSSWRKVPITPEGVSANLTEAAVSRRYWAALSEGKDWDQAPGAMPFARCSLEPNGVLVVEPLSILIDPADIPAEHRWWTGAVDCSQVGWTRDGQLVAYDL